MRRRLWLALAWSLFGAIVPSLVHAQRSAPPAVYQPKPSAKDAGPAKLRLAADARARTITLPAPTADERAQLARNDTSGTAKTTAIKARRVQIGYARELPVASATMRLAELPWQDAGNNIRAAQLRLTSPGAAALRVGISLHRAPASLQVRFAGAARESMVFGPYDARALTEPSIYWSPVLDGDTAIVEVEVPAETSLDGASLAIPMISHLEATGSALKQQDPLGRIGVSGACEVDVMCLDPAVQSQAASAIHAVARMVIVDRGATYLCTGTLLNDSVSSMTPHFFTANHCLDGSNGNPALSRGFPAAAAGSITTFWFFHANVCGVHNNAGVEYVQVAGGARLVGRSNDYDWSLLKLNSPPPPGVTMAAWSGDGPIAVGTSVAGIHHPAGDLKKFSQGLVRGYSTERDGSSYIRVEWSEGVTEGGSSGSGLFVLNPSNGYYELRGGLWGGLSACTPASLRNGIDTYSRMDVAYPYLAGSLTPDRASSQVPVIEFYNAGLDDYFITADAGEIADLDRGFHPGWVRTGLTFIAYRSAADAPAGARPVCRFYVLPGIGDSHFYSADPEECAQTAARFAGSWVQESAAVFHIQVPDASGVCPANTQPVFRFLNVLNQLHHRYTVEVDVRDSHLRIGGWQQEGVGATTARAVMCSPTTS